MRLLNSFCFWVAYKEEWLELFHRGGDRVDDFRGKSCSNDDWNIRGGNVSGIGLSTWWLLEFISIGDVLDIGLSTWWSLAFMVGAELSLWWVALIQASEDRSFVFDRE